MDFNLTISYSPESDLIDITLNPKDTDTNTSNHIVVSRKFYKAFVSALWATGQRMQEDKVDVGFTLDGGDNND